MWNSECGMEGRASIPHSAFRIPHLSAVKHRRLFRAPWGRKAEMLVRARRGAAAARRAGQEPLLHEERLVHFLQRSGILAPRGGDRGGAPRGAPAPRRDGLWDPPRPVVEGRIRPGPT